MAVAIVLAPLALSSCSNEDNYWTEPVTISGPGVVHHAVTIEAGQTLQLKATNGIFVHGTGFAWTSSDPSVATIDQSGLVTALTTGETTITAATTGNSVINFGAITVYVIGSGVGLVDDQIDQSEAE